MHGRLKIKTTAEQQEEKRKEREEKRKSYLKIFNQALQLNDASTFHEFFKASGLVLCANPDLATFWNHRRKLILSYKGDDKESILEGELDLTKSCLMKNPKSYCAWHHRSWVFSQHSSPSWDKEMMLCDQYLKLDERNFHCWDHRRFVVQGSNRSSESELKVSKDLIEKNFSNYSAWHYRSKLLPELHPPQPNTPHPIDETSLVEELKMVVDAVFTDPSDQSPWFFLRWLINKQASPARMVEACVARTDESTSRLVCIYSAEVTSQSLPRVSIDGSVLPQLTWASPASEEYSTVWVTYVEMDSESDHKVSFDYGEHNSVSLILPSQSEEQVKIRLHENKDNLSELTKKTLMEIKDNCTSLDELDPNNKWVLLTLVDVLWALDYKGYKNSIINYLDQLQKLDQLRHSYYQDMKSKLHIKIGLDDHIVEGYTEEFVLNSSQITKIYEANYLASFTRVCFRNNCLTAIQPLYLLACCKSLNLSQNKYLSDITPLYTLKTLEKLNLCSCNVNCEKMAVGLAAITSLKKLNLLDNPVGLFVMKAETIKFKFKYILELDI